jgi:nitric oxide reductase NorE protein
VQSTRRAHLPGETGIWFFVFGDLTVFGLLFATFLFYRAQDVDLYRASQQTLSPNFGALNTLLLLTSSWLVALAVDAARRQRTRAAPLFFALAFVCGAGFAVDKFLEYGAKIHAGITPASNDFYMYYYVLTGIHFLHLCVGMVVLAFLFAASRKPLSAAAISAVESGATFWHLVDLVWIVLFALLYLLG